MWRNKSCFVAFLQMHLAKFSCQIKDVLERGCFVIVLPDGEPSEALLHVSSLLSCIMEFPDLGAHCALTTCKRLDFLPVKCAGCKSVFCGEHFSPLAHSCAVAAVRDARVPVCPLCDAPVPVRRKGDAPDVAVSAHIDADCQSDPAVERRRKIFDQRCAVKKCKKKEMIRLQCNECGKNFCLSHRHPLV